MHIGLIGGIGPAATIVYYDRLTRRVRDAGGRLELTIVQADVQDLIRNVLADRREEQCAEAVVLAGTDLNLAFDGVDPGYPVIDALDVHVAVLADLALDRRTLSVPTP